MQFDIPTLYSLLAIESLVLALALAALMGWRQLASGARHAQAAMTLHGLGWLLLMLAPSEGSRWMGALAMGSIGAALSALWFSIAHWLGARRGRLVVLLLPLLPALVYLLAFENHALRTGLGNALFALQLLLLCASLLLPATALEPELRRQSWHWRGPLLLALASMAALTAWRAALAFFATGALPSFTAPHPLNTVAAVCALLAVPLTLAALLTAWRGETENSFLRLAQTDALTGLCNRRAFVARALDLISMARRYKEPLALMVLDIEQMKHLNEELGAEGADRALKLFADCVREQMRQGDLAARIRGDDFAVLMVRCDALGPQAMDKRMRDALASRAPAELGRTLEFSAGWARLRHGDRNVEDLMRRAEAALYEAKRSGSACLMAEPGLEG